ncbi:MAG: TonB-dependent receptor [Pyrinomonadaceae bacterium]|nr:TonB-dependent receptor [Blastocatellia bacterium]MCW5957215.1 TonB-dependent receptor [Pyrinomonadaceae bacterium]
MLIRTMIAAAFLYSATAIFAQSNNTLRVQVKNKDTNEPVAAANVTVKGTEISLVADTTGIALLSMIPDGEQTIVISSPGYDEAEIKAVFPLTGSTERTVFLELNNEVGSVTINSTRTGREIEAEPTRVEAIDEEELDEKINMRPANVSMALHESTGIQVQQTSATSNTQSIRIQGLDGRYTQILKDGFPAFGGFSGSLSVLEIPPLDLKQVEVIKGPSATLFGGDAIAGVVNFITKDPEEKPVTTLVFNLTSAGGTDVSAFNSRKLEKFGYTVLGSANFQRPHDVDNDEFTDLPGTKSFGVNPKLLFYIDDKTTLAIGNSISYQSRKGGDILAARGDSGPLYSYFEKNDSIRNITTLNFDRVFADGSRLNAKQSLAFFKRDLTTPSYQFKGSQFNSFTDLSYFRVFEKHTLVFGGSAVHDQFREGSAPASTQRRDETRTTFGGFIQDTIDLTEKVSLEAGFRLDHAKHYGTFALPRVSMLYRISENLTTRVGVGLGYKTPTVFTEEAERLLFRNVLPIGNDLNAERSRGGTFDINYRGRLGERLSYSLNQMFFYTQITDPVVLRQVESGKYQFANADSSVISRGFETNLRIGYGIAKLFAGYTFTDAKAGYLPGDRRLTLLPRSRVNSSLVFEEHKNFKAGVEFYYQSRQTLEDRSRTRSTAEVGVFAEKTFGKFSIFFNAENLTDVRQSRYSQVVIPPSDNPTFAELWTHLEGRIFNGGIKIRL